MPFTEEDKILNYCDSKRSIKGKGTKKFANESQHWCLSSRAYFRNFIITHTHGERRSASRAYNGESGVTPEAKPPVGVRD